MKKLFVTIFVMGFSVALMGCTQNQSSPSVSTSSTTTVPSKPATPPPPQPTSDSGVTTSVEVMESEEKMEEKEMNEAMTDNNAMEASDSYQGEILTGDQALYIDYNQADYEKAINSDKLVVHYFYANWCPICKAEVLSLKKAFEQLETDDVVGFQINFNDSKTSPAEEALAKKFGVAYQHTKVFIKNGERVLKAPDSWNTERYLTEINNHL